MKFDPQFGTPQDDIEIAAHKWLTENLGQEGASVMKSLAALMRAAALASPSVRLVERDTLIKHMVDRFLGWKLPSNFNPDAGISFKAAFNEHTAHPMKHEPTGTNLFDATQADAMVRYLIEGLPALSAEQPVVGKYRADYSPLTPEEIAKNDPELTELYANSTPAEQPLATGEREVDTSVLIANAEYLKQVAFDFEDYAASCNDTRKIRNLQKGIEGLRRSAQQLRALAEPVWPEVTQEQVDAVDKLVAPEFETGNWVYVEREISAEQPRSDPAQGKGDALIFERCARIAEVFGVGRERASYGGSDIATRIRADAIDYCALPIDGTGAVMIEVGQEMRWQKTGSRSSYRVKVLKVNKRITVAVPITRGGTRTTVVSPNRLFPLPPTPQTEPLTEQDLVEALDAIPQTERGQS
jgi:hypothetical protein